MNAITVENVSKRYLIDHQARSDTLRDALAHGARGLWNRLRRGRLQQEEFWALRDISFEVKSGEVLGIIGRNGAGKSTLLKILSRITEPSTGRIHLRGRVASLLEVGTGFHPELSGRENIYLNGAILGMSRAEITRKFDEIVAFAEVERFLDTPVKRYSSGMYVRLAFAVAAHLEPEILIVDEVLAVGDAAFQKKCLGKISEVSRHQGRTVLFVSHNLGIVANLCTRAILLEAGRLREQGPATQIVTTYIQAGNTGAGETVWTPDDPKAGNHRVRLHRARVRSEEQVAHAVSIDRDVWIEYDFEVVADALLTTSSIHLFDKHGICVLSNGPATRQLSRGRYRHRVKLPGNFLNDGLYSVSILLITDNARIDVHITEALTFCVNETGTTRGTFGGVIIGCIRPQLEWQTEGMARQERT